MDITGSTYIDHSALAIESQKAQMKNLESQNMKEAREAAEDFEAFFLSRTMESMFDTVSTEGPFGGGSAEKIYRSLLINEYGKSMAQTGGIGVADYVMDTILQIQEAQNIEVKGE